MCSTSKLQSSGMAWIGPLYFTTQSIIGIRMQSEVRYPRVQLVRRFNWLAILSGCGSHNSTGPSSLPYIEHYV